MKIEKNKREKEEKIDLRKTKNALRTNMDLFSKATLVVNITAITHGNKYVVSGEEFIEKYCDNTLRT